jgi:hypothetical protein
MFLAHFSSTPLNVLMEMPSNELHKWYNEAVKTYNYLNRTEDG